MSEHTHRCKTCPYFAYPEHGPYGECRLEGPQVQRQNTFKPGIDYFCGEHPALKKMVSDFLLSAPAPQTDRGEG